MDVVIDFFNKHFTNMNEHCICENLLFSIGPLTALLAARYGLKAWIKYEIFTSVLIGAILVVKPKLLFDHMLNSKLTSFHFYTCALYAAYLIWSILYPLVVIGSEDKAVFYGHIWAKIIANTLILIDNLHAYGDGLGLHWNYKLLCLSGSFALFSLLINIYFLVRSRKPSGQNPFRDCANSVAKVEFYLLLVSGIVIYTFPDKFAARLGAPKDFNESHRSLLRICGALILSLSLESFCMSEFIFLKDKKAFMLSRVFGAMLELAAFLAGHYYYKVYSIEIMGFLVALNIAYVVLVFYGFVITPQEPKQKAN